MMTDTKEAFLTSAQLRERWGDVSHMFIARRLKGDAEFPKPLKIGRLLFWRQRDIEAYERICTRRRTARVGEVE